MEEMQWEKCLKTIFQKYKRTWCQFAWNMWKKELRRFIFIVLGFTAGFLGIGTGLFVYLTLLCSLKSFGVPYTTPITPSSSDNNGYFIPPIWKQEYRDSFLSPKRKKSQAKISMKWKY